METILLDNIPTDIYDVEDKWVMYKGEPYFVFFIDNDTNKITIINNDNTEIRDIVMTSDLAFTSVKPHEILTGQVLYTGREVAEPTLMTIAECYENQFFAYCLEDDQGQQIAATQFDVVSINF